MIVIATEAWAYQRQRIFPYCIQNHIAESSLQSWIYNNIFLTYNIYVTFSLVQRRSLCYLHLWWLFTAHHLPLSKKSWNNFVLFTWHRLRRWPNIKQTLDRCLVFAMTMGIWRILRRISSATSMQTAVTAYLKSKQLLLFAFRQQCNRPQTQSLLTITAVYFISRPWGRYRVSHWKCPK